MAGFPTFTPRTANTAAIWKDFNPAASFLGGMKAVRQMDLDDAAEERLRESAEVDRMVKTTMLPLEMEKTRAETQRLMALSSLAMSKRTEMADSASQTAILEQFLNEPFDNVVRPRGGSQSSTGSSFSSGLSSGGDYELDTSGGLFGNEQTSVDFDSLPTPNMKNLTNPKYAMVSAPTGMSTDQPPGAAENQILEARAADSRDAVRKLDWDDLPNNVPASPQKPKGAATSEQEQELKKIRSELYPNQNPLESLPNAQSKNEGPGLGNFIADSVSDAKYFENQAALFPKRKGGGKAPEALAYEARAYAIRQKLPGEAASRYGIQDPSIINQLYSTKTGVTRSASEIDKIYDTMQKGYVELPDNQGALQRVPVESVEDAIARVEQLRTLMPKQGTAGSSDPLKTAQDLRSQRIQLTEAISKEGVGEEDKKMFRAEINRVDRQLNSLVSPEERAYEFAENSQNIFNMARNYDDTSKNFEGEVITKDSVNKTTPALKFTEEVLSRSIPSITVIKSPSGEYELSNKSEVETYFKDRNLPVPSRFPTGVYIKDGKGLSAPLPAIIDFSKDGEPELTWAVDPAKYIQSDKPTPVQDQKGRKARPEVPSGGVSYAEEPETWMDRYPEDFKNFYGPIAKGIAKPFNRSDQEQYNLSLEKLEELNAILEKAPENIAAIKQRNIHAETINKLLSEGKVKVKPGTGKAPGDPEGKIQWVSPLSNQ
jgi:hypothetical protein